MAASSKTLSFILIGVCVGNCALVAAALGAAWLSVNGAAIYLFSDSSTVPSLTGARACGVIAAILIYLQALIVLVAALSSKARFVHANVTGFVGAVFAIASFASWFSFFNTYIIDTNVNNGAGSWLMFVSGLVALATVGLGFKVNSKGSGSSAPPAPRSAPPPSQSQQQNGQPPPPPPMQEMPRRNTTTPVGGAAMPDPNYNPFKPVDTQASQMQRV